MMKHGYKNQFLSNKLSHLIDDEVMKTKRVNERHQIDVINGGLPDEVNWMNIKYNKNNRMVRKIIIWLIAIILILMAFSFMVFLKNEGNELT